MGNTRPYNLSEFTILPIYTADENTDDPSSVIIWGGYVDHDSWNNGSYKENAELQIMYGNDWKDFSLSYLRRLLRFDISTNVCQKLTPTSDILPKAMSFACVDKCENGVLRFLVGGGYGISPSKMEWTEKQIEKRDLCRSMAAAGLVQPVDESGMYVSNTTFLLLSCACEYKILHFTSSCVATRFQ